MALQSNFLRRWLKYLFIGISAAVVLCVVLAALLLFFLDDENYRAMAIWSAEHLAGWQMAVDGPFEVRLSGTASLLAGDIRFEPLPGGEMPVLKRIGRFHTRIALAPLLRGLLVIEDVDVDDVHFAYEKPTTSESPSGLPGWLWRFLTPVVERAVLNHWQIDFIDIIPGHTDRLMLRRLTLDDRGGSGLLRLQGNGCLNSGEFQIAGQMGGTLQYYEEYHPFPIDLQFTIADFQATLSGGIDHPMDGQGFNLKIAVEEQELANLLQAFQSDIPPIGRFTFSAELTGDIQDLHITELDLAVSNGTTIQMAAEGSIPDLTTGRGTAVNITQKIESSSLLSWIFPDDLKVVEEFRLSAALRNVDGHYTIENFDARVANDKGIVLKADGSLELGNPLKESLLAAVDLNLHITSPDTAAIRPLLTDAIPEIGGGLAKARLVGPIDNLALEDLFIERGGNGPVQLVSRGRIGRIPLADDEPIDDMDLAVSIQAENSELLRQFYEIPFGELGTVDLTGQIVGSSRRFSLQDVKLHTKTEEGLETRVTGGIDFKQGQDGEVVGDLDFKLHFDAATLGIAEPLLGVSIMHDLGPIRGDAKVRGTSDVMAIEDIVATGGHPDRLFANWRGRINRIPLIADGVSSGHETNGTLYASRSSDFAALFGITLADVGPVRGSWRDTDHEGILGATDIKFVIGDGQRFDLQANGKIDKIVDLNQFDSVESQEITFDGVDIRFNLNTSDTHGIAKLIDLPIPDLGSVSGSWRVTGGDNGLAIRNARLASTSTAGLEMEAAGEVPHIDVAPAGGIRDIDFQIKARAPDIKAVPWPEADALPDLGALNVSARLTDREGALDIDRVQIRTGPETEPTFYLEGRLRDVDDLQRVHLDADFKTGARLWLDGALNQTITANPQLEGALELGRTADHLRIDRFHLSARESGGFAIEGAGTIALAGQSPRVDLQILTEAADPAALGDLFDVSLPPLAPTQITGWYREEENQHQFSGEVRLGASRFQTDFHGTTQNRKPVIEATLAAQTLRLQDLGFYPESEKSEPRPDPASQDHPPFLFDEHPLPLESLDHLDLSLKILADQIVSREAVFNKVGLDLTLKDGRLQIGPMTINYLNGASTVDAVIDTNASPPEMALNITVEDADIEELLTSVDRPLVLGGQLTLFTDLRSRGRSAREIAVNLQGETGFVVENGQIKREIDLMASDALDFLFTGPASSSYTDLNCTAFRMLFKEGTGTIQTFHVETPGMRAEAFGHIDLTDETVAIIVNPTPKRRLIRRSSPVRIVGPLQDPSIYKVPAEEAAILAGQILVPYVAIPARVLGYLWSLVSRDEVEGSCFLPPENEP
jgi:AsmA-like C-terminal region